MSDNPPHGHAAAANDTDTGAVFRRRMDRVARLLRWRHRDATAAVVQIVDSRTSLIAVLGTDESGNEIELWNLHDSDDGTDDDPVENHLTAATSLAHHDAAGALSWTRHDDATYRAPLPPTRRARRHYVDTAPAVSQDRQVMPSAATANGVEDGLPRYPASTPLTGSSVFTGLATLDHVILGRVGDTVREMVSYNGGHTLIGFLAVTDDGHVHATPHDPDLDPSRGPRPDGVDLDEDADPATSALLIAAVDSPRPWFGPFDSRGLAEAFLLGWAGGNGLLTLTRRRSPTRTPSRNWWTRSPSTRSPRSAPSSSTDR